MKKIIDIITKLPSSCETSKFPANFASVWMSIEGLTNVNMTKEELGEIQVKAHNLYAVVSGISLIQLDLSNEGHLMPWWGPNATKLLDEYDDYVKFTMDFAGYSYERFNKETDKTIVFNSIKHSIDTGHPVLMNFGAFYDWFTITGYDDESGRLYGYDVSQDNQDDFPAAEGYEDGMFYLSGWYEEMTDAVVVTKKSAPVITYDDVFRRMIHILENMLEIGYFKRSANFLRDNTNFENYDNEQYLHLAQRIEMFIGLPIDQRNVVSLCFEELAQMEVLKDKHQYFKRISALYDNTLDTCWIAWRMVGAFGLAPVDECVKALKNPIVRCVIGDIIGIITKNDRIVLEVLKEMVM